MSLLIPVKDVQADEVDLQSRVGMDRQTVEEYRDFLKDNTDKDLPPVRCVREGKDYWLWDGFHTLQAYLLVGRARIPVDATDGTKREAWLLSLGANATHGLKRTNADKRKAVTSALKDDEVRRWADRKIAELCGVRHTIVGQVRRELYGVASDATPNNSLPPEKIVGRDGVEQKNPAHTKAQQQPAREPEPKAPVRYESVEEPAAQAHEDGWAFGSDLAGEESQEEP
jgi:hypothetical protein